MSDESTGPLGASTTNGSNGSAPNGAARAPAGDSGNNNGSNGNHPPERQPGVIHNPRGDTSNNPLAISVRDVHVEYEVHENRRAAIRERITTGARSNLAVVHAVKGVSFDVRQGESIALLGSNGSGKSTLLSAIAGVLPTSAGEILVTEEPKLLGFGATLIPTASGRRNILLGCLAQGMTSDQVEQNIERLIEFTELGDAIERPLRTYSSGMRARVGFAIATAITPRVLLVDEALAVGDRRFMEKSTERITEILAEAGVLILVSHAMTIVQQFCERAIWIEKGDLIMDGPIEEVVEAYEAA